MVRLRRGGFVRIQMRGDTAVRQAALLDRWDADCIEFGPCETADRRSPNG